MGDCQVHKGALGKFARRISIREVAVAEID
jgi:hypothetical protein